ncbi:transcriptional regulator, TetR family [Atopomonas hussainii]|uniref:Transcriptional regulator, TetR family n=1 Tax=Atopomonas hussainii TaxID=1429083 RepID=A0A1H7SVB3_9GAMM|nr:TetR/AcrR family transcriptional regulator [Atopomonas hussainii]SEL75854.1 transcriptional regulator, TetR family [Atopomonas hussainii]
MRYSNEHKAQTRQKLLDSSACLAKEGGFASTGVDALMKAIGLTGGAFYSHFSSKEDLFASLVAQELARSVALLSELPGQGAEKLRQAFALYLNPKHVAAVGQGCMLPSLGSEISRAAPEVRENVEQALQTLVSRWANEHPQPELAWGMLAQCVGSIVLARMLATEAAQKAVLASSQQLLEQLLSAQA